MKRIIGETGCAEEGFELLAVARGARSVNRLGETVKVDSSGHFGGDLSMKRWMNKDSLARYPIYVT